MMVTEKLVGSSLPETENRIEWVDIYKGIAIILMVVGHSTGRFNQYIYQFHMAAFFFISGFTADFSKRGHLRNLWYKACTLLMPYVFVFGVFMLGDRLLIQFGLRDYILADVPYIGLINSIRQLLAYGNCYAWLLGAGWFIVVLFGIEILHKLFDSLCLGSRVVYFLLTVLTYCVGTALAHAGNNFKLGMFSVTLIFIGQTYYGIGKCVRDIGLLDDKTRKADIVILIINLFLFNLFGNILQITVDYPTLYFNKPVYELFEALNGCLFVYVLSKYLCKIQPVRKALIFLGMNTLGIVFFHFLYFKLAFLLLWALGVTPFSTLNCFVPPAELGNSYWYLISAVAIVFSLITWLLLLKLPGLTFLLGKDKKSYNKIYDFVIRRSYDGHDPVKIAVEKVISFLGCSWR